MAALSRAFSSRHSALFACLSAAALVVAGCASKKPVRPPSSTLPGAADVIQQPKSQWIPATWSDLPGFAQDAVSEAWPALLRSCARPTPVFAQVCQEAARLQSHSDADKRAWLMQRLRPYRVQGYNGAAQGVLTSYYEPVMTASRQPNAVWRYPLHAVPAGGAPRKAWYTRQQIDTHAAAKAALAGRELVWMADPIAAMILHVQGSGRMQVQEPDGSSRTVRMAFAGTNQQPFRSPSSWIAAHGSRASSWEAIRAWAALNPNQMQAMLWSNPRYVFFREEAIPATEWDAGPRGAQGVPLTPGRSLAVDRDSIPYGTPVWMSSTGAVAQLHKLAVAQDTGSAIKGAVRADYFAGWSPEAADLAHRLKQPLYLWVLWPR